MVADEIEVVDVRGRVERIIDAIKAASDEVPEIAPQPAAVVRVRGVLVCEVCGWWDDMVSVELDQVPPAILAEVLSTGGLR